MCTDGVNCKRRICFFAHTEEELRKPEDDPVWLQQQVQAELTQGVQLLHGWGENGSGHAWLRLSVID